jgi:hypothetical protein
MLVAEFAVRRATGSLISISVAVAAAIGAFQASARAHLLETLLEGARCGNPLQQSAPTLMGHCAACWGAGALAGVLALSAMAMVLQTVGLRRIP